MSTLQSETSTETDRPERNWATEVLIVAGIVAFGYFVVMFQSQPAGFADHALDAASIVSVE